MISSRDKISVLLGKSNARFQSQTTYTAGDDPQEIVTADFNDDGYLDLAVANEDSDSVGVYLGNGDGTFTVSAAIFSTGGSVKAVDFNRDHAPDILMADNGVVYTALNDGAGVFRSGRSFFAGGRGPTQLAIFDANGDGVIDVVTGISTQVTPLFGR